MFVCCINVVCVHICRNVFIRIYKYTHTMYGHVYEHVHAHIYMNMYTNTM